MAPVDRPAFLAVDWNGTVVPFFGREGFPGAVDALTKIRSLGLYLCIVSHADQDVIERDVQRVGLIADEIHGVMEKAPVLVALRARWGPGLMIGDHQEDWRAAQAAQLPFLQSRTSGQPVFEEGLNSFQAWPEVALVLGFPVGD